MIIEIDPVAKPRMTQRDRWVKRPCTQKYWAFKDKLNQLVSAEELPERIHVVFQIPMPKSWSAKKRASQIGQPHKVRPDTDNLMKAFKDAVFEEDSAIWDERGTKLWGETGRIEIKEIVD